MDDEKLNLWMEALREVGDEMGTKPESRSAPYTIRTIDVVSGIEAKNPSILYLGVDESANPLSVDLRSDHANPVLIDTGSEDLDREIMRSMITAHREIHPADKSKFAIASNSPHIWKKYNSAHALSIDGFYENAFLDRVLSLASWAHQNKGKQTNFLFIDGFDDYYQKPDFDSSQNLRWLMLRGAERGVYIVMSRNGVKNYDHKPWLDNFKSKIEKDGKSGLILKSPKLTVRFTKTSG